MNLAPNNYNYSYGKEEDRICIRFRPHDDEDERRLVVRMSRAEAKTLGEILVKYGTAVLQHEQEHTAFNCPACLTVRCKLSNAVSG